MLRRLDRLLCCLFGAVSAMGSLCAAEQPAQLPSSRIPEGLGVNIHFTEPRPGELGMLSDGGFKFVRMDFTWASTEQKPRRFDFSSYDRLLAALDKKHLRAVLILDYGNPLYDGGNAPATEAGRDAFVRWAVAGITHFRNRGVVWEMWNEPNILFWKPKPDAAAYSKLAAAVGKAIRQTPAIAGELFIGPASSTFDFKFLEVCFQAGCLDYWDAVSVHPYRQDEPTGDRKASGSSVKPGFNHSGDPETVLKDYERLQALIRKYAPAGKAVPIISGEWGYSAGWRAYDPQRQGKMLARQWLVNLSAGIPLSIWYDWHDDGPNPQEPEHHFGTVEHEYRADRAPVFAPKPAYEAAATLTRTLNGFQFNKFVKQGEDNHYVLEFGNGGRRAWAAWTTREPMKTLLPLPAGRYTVVSLLGQTRDGRADSSGLPLVLTDAVQYVLPAQQRVTGLRFHNDTIIRRREFSGDNWHTTWAADGNQYVLQCDGRGYNTRMWRLIGQPPDFRFEPVAEHPGPKEPPPARYYGFGILAVGKAIYHFYSTPDRWDEEPKKFIGAKLIYSPDGGKSWHNQDRSTPVVFEPWRDRSRKNMTFFNEPDDSFSLLSMLQMGKAYQLNDDGFIYVYSPNGSVEGTMNQLVMFRVPKDRLLDRHAYEYFVARDPGGGAKWSRDINDRKPVHQFPSGWVNKFDHPYAWHPSVVYNAGLGSYMMANWGIGTDESGKWFVKPSYLGVWVAEHPWGPWRQIHEDTAWFPPGGEKGGQCYQPQIMPGWIAADGKSFWLAWTQFPVGYYFQCQKVEVVTE